jgi:hypothetical protein
MVLGATAMSVATEIDESVPVSKGFKATVNGLVWEGRPSFEAWATAMKTLRVVERGSQFALGDGVIYGEDRYGEQASQVLDVTEGWSEKTIAIYKWLAERIPKDVRRMDRLGIAHHLAVATLTAAKQKHWLTLAADDEMARPWTVARLKQALREGEDLPATDFYVLVRCETGQMQSDLMDRLEAEGLTVKAVTRRQRKVEAA